MQLNHLIIGWKEWLALPHLDIPAIKAKIDTGARTSALHAFQIEPMYIKNALWVKFGIHPVQRRKDIALFCEAPVVDQRDVKDSGGHIENRFVIATPVAIKGRQWVIEITLTHRDDMLFHMLLGRTALADHCIVDPGRKYLTGRKLKKIYAKATI